MFMFYYVYVVFVLFWFPVILLFYCTSVSGWYLIRYEIDMYISNERRKKHKEHSKSLAENDLKIRNWCLTYRLNSLDNTSFFKFMIINNEFNSHLWCEVWYNYKKNHIICIYSFIVLEVIKNIKKTYT